MISMKVKVDAALTKALNDLPFQVQFKCIDPAARKMAQPIVRVAKTDPPDSRSTTGTQRWARDPSIPPQDKWSASAEKKYNTGPSGQHVISKYWKASRGGILYIGMQASKQALGKKMHFRIPILKKRRVVFYWGRPGQVITQTAGRNKAVITYTRGAGKTKPKANQAPAITAGSTIPLERRFFIKTAYERAFHSAMGIFKNEFYKQAKGLTLG